MLLLHFFFFFPGEVKGLVCPKKKISTVLLWAVNTAARGESFKPPVCGELTALLLSAARKADPRARRRATPATGEREASPGSDGGVRAGKGADGFTAAAVLQVKM